MGDDRCRVRIFWGTERAKRKEMGDHRGKGEGQERRGEETPEESPRIERLRMLSEGNSSNFLEAQVRVNVEEQGKKGKKTDETSEANGFYN
jgi:hypothetical protein